MRGKGIFFRSISAFSRITPAYAGKSTCRKTNRQHLHGSPPPMRGKDADFLWICITDRITPAYAGKRLLVTTTETASRDHPRLCGEKASLTAYFNDKQGSPPPMRGKVQPAHMQYFLDRITPAYAGKRQKDCLKIGSR